jgi:hypothetical protein
VRFEELKRYSPLYRSSKRAGAATILNKAFGLERDTVVPLSISHGVDFDMCKSAMDVHGVEPLHWAYNACVFERALPVKPCIRLPHPWWFVVRGQEIPVGSRVLVIGPPPSRTNDQRLLTLLREFYDIKDLDILLKSRGDISNSDDFWRKNGAGVITAGPQDDRFYYRLFNIFKQYELVVCCTFSSASFFAASINKKVNFLKGYRYLSYDIPEYEEKMNFGSTHARKVASIFLTEGKEKVTELARDTLGFSDRKISELRNDYISEVSSIRHPSVKRSGAKFILREIALAVKRPSVANLTSSGILNKILPYRQVQVVEKEVDEMSIWTDGINSTNFKISRVPEIRGKTVPGRGFDR